MSVEPSDVGPAYGGDRAVSDSDRSQVSRLLSAAYADGRLSVEEHERRQLATQLATTFDDLIPLTRDLVAGAGVPVPAAAYAHYNPAPSDQSDLLVGIFGGNTRRGTFALRRRVTAIAVFGGHTLDLTEALWDGPNCTLDVFCLFGGVEVYLPDGVEVQDRTVAIFGGSDIKGVTPAAPGAPVLIVRGLCGFGGVTIRGPRSKKWQRR